MNYPRLFRAIRKATLMVLACTAVIGLPIMLSDYPIAVFVVLETYVFALLAAHNYSYGR